MPQAMIDIPEELDKKIRRKMVDIDLNNKKEIIVFLLEEYFKNEESLKDGK